MTWPMRVASCDGVVEKIDLHSGRVTLRPFEGRRRTVYMPDDVETFIYVNEGDEVSAGATFVMGCLGLPRQVACRGETWDIEADLVDPDPSTRYAAVKAVGARRDADFEGELLPIATDAAEDDRVRLEAYASLSRLDPERWTPHVAAKARERRSGDRGAMEMAMEAIFILSELRTDEATDALERLASDPRLDSEARCAAVWGMGVAGVNDAARILPFIADEDEDVALHALAAIERLPNELYDPVVEMLGGSDRQAASAAALLARQGIDGAKALLPRAAGGGREAIWALAALGDMAERDVRALSRGLPPRVEHALCAMWATRNSWLRRQEMDTPLRFLERQRIRYLD